jgi:hypothetical protein
LNEHRNRGRLADILLGRLIIRLRLPRTAGEAAIVARGKAGRLKYLLKKARLFDPELLEIADFSLRKSQHLEQVEDYLHSHD